MATQMMKSPLPHIPIPPAERRASAHWGIRSALALLNALLAATAISGAIFVVPTLPRAWLYQGLITPFADYAIPALTLGLLCGGSALSALAATLTNARAGALGSLIAGVCILGFELVEIAVVGFTPVRYPTLVPAWLQVFYLALGAMLVVLAVRLWKATAPTGGLLPRYSKP